MIRKTTLFIFYILSVINLNAQYEIQVSIKNPVDSIVYFRVCTFDDKLYTAKDTFRLGRNRFYIKENKSIYGGIYYLYFPQSKQRIYLALDNKDKFSLSLIGDQLLDSAKSTSEKNKLFIDYQLQERKFHNLDSEYQNLVKAGKATLSKRETLYSQKVSGLSSFRATSLKYLDRQSALYIYFKTLNEIDGFTPSKKNYFLREEFIKKFNLQSEQLYFSPAIKPILYEYLSSFPLIADSILKAIDTVMKKVDCKSKSYGNVFNYFVNILQNGSIQEHTKGYNTFLDRYLISSSCKSISPAKQSEYLEIYKQYEQLNKQEIVSEIQLKDTAGIVQSLIDFSKKYTYIVLCFYDPNCKHCDELIPELHRVVSTINTTKNFRVGIYAVCNTEEVYKSDWLKFISKHKLSQDYMHVILGDQKKVRDSYVAYSNPMFYLLDQDGLYIMKKTNIGAINRFLIRGN